MNRGGPGAEVARLRALRAYRSLDAAEDARFDELAALAARLCGASKASIAFWGEEGWWSKATFGTPAPPASEQEALSHRALDRAGEVVVMPVPASGPEGRDAEREPAVLFRAAPALLDPSATPLGVLCVMDEGRRTLSDVQSDALRAIARQVVDLIERQRTSDLLNEEIHHRERAEAGLRQLNEELVASQREASRLLDLAEKSRGALLSILEDEHRTGQALTRSNRALKMLSTCNEALIWAKDEASLLTQVCRIAVELGGHGMAFIAYVEDDPGKTLRPMGQWGDTTGYLDEIPLTWDADTPAGRGPAGRCVREGLPMACPDIRKSEWSCQHVAATEARGYRSVVCLPLRDAERTFGLLGLYSSEIRELEEGEVRLLKELADDISLGVTALRSRIVRERAEAALLASLREKEALLKEVHHRVKNNLQVIASLLRLESRRIEHPITQQVLSEMQNRIQSMALLHETIYRSGNFATVDLAAYLSQLTRQMFRSLARQSEVSLHLDLAPASLEIDQAIPCGLIVNELASNSLKHGFPPGRRGAVSVRLTRAADERLTITVSDDGIGLPPGFVPGESGSLGLQLVKDLAGQLQGTLAIGPGPQARFEVSFKPSGGATAHPPQTGIAANADAPGSSL